jgi:dTDP-glucose 4,6-dehydratase
MVINVDKLTYAGSKTNLLSVADNKRHVFIPEDIVNEAVMANIFRQYAVKTVVHFAAETHVDRSIVNPHEFVRTNVLGTQVLLAVAKQYWMEAGLMEKACFLYISTDEIYGATSGEQPHTEESSICPTNPYAVSKAAGEMMALAYHKTYGFPSLSVRCSNVYGPRQYPEKLIPLFIRNLLEGKPLPLYGDGEQIRQWIYVSDCCRGVHTVLTKGRLGESYNIAGLHTKTNVEVAGSLIDAVRKNWGSSLPCPAGEHLIQYVGDRPGHDRRYWICGKKVKGLGFEPRTEFKEGLQDTVLWYRKELEK